MLLALVITNLLTAVLVMSMNQMDAHAWRGSGGMTETRCQQQMMNSLGKADKNYDLRFINAMIPHHEGAVKMGKDALQKAQHKEIKALAESIIHSQEKEIAQMQAWRKDWYGQ